MKSEYPPAALATEVWVYHRYCSRVTARERSALILTLSEAERARRSRLRTAEARAQFLIAHGALRVWLAALLAVDPATLVFAANPCGKPYLTTPASDLRFNLSHAGDLVVCAVTAGAEVGIDIEPLDAALPGADAYAQFLSPAELDALRALPVALQRRAFLHAWTCKEALIKATGEGFSANLQALTVAIDPRRPVAALAPGQRFALATLPLDPNYAAALALDAPARAILLQDA